MKRVLLVQPSLQPPGGGNGVAAWVLQALAPEHDVTVLSWRPVEVEPINRFFGTHLRRDDFETIVVPRSWRHRGPPARSGDARQAVAADAVHAPRERRLRRHRSACTTRPTTAGAAFSTSTTPRTCGRGPTSTCGGITTRARLERVLRARRPPGRLLDGAHEGEPHAREFELDRRHVRSLPGRRVADAVSAGRRSGAGPAVGGAAPPFSPSAAFRRRRNTSA